MAAGGTGGALSGGGVEAVVQGALLGGATGALGGGLYAASVPWWALAGGGAAIATATGGLDGLAYYAGGLLGGIAGYSASSYLKQNWLSYGVTANQSAGYHIIDPELCIDPEFPQEFVTEFEQLWAESKPGRNWGSTEQGLIYVGGEDNPFVRISNTLDSYVGDQPGGGSSSIVMPGSVPSKTLFWAHTHPNWGAAPGGRLWQLGFSGSDIGYSNSIGVAGYAIDVKGYVRYDPTSGRACYVHLR
jgi:hypothetical protein